MLRSVKTLIPVADAKYGNDKDLTLLQCSQHYMAPCQHLRCTESLILYSHYSVWINSPLVHAHISLTGVEATVVVRVIVLVHCSISEVQKPDRH